MMYQSLAAFDNALEQYLIIGGYSIEQAMMLLIPEAWEKNSNHSKELRSYYEYYANYIEPWDGPAAMCFTDGQKIEEFLDRNGLRPSRYCQTEDGMILLSSEMGVLDLSNKKIVKKWRLEPGKMFLIDLEKQKIIENDQLKKKFSSKFNYEINLKKIKYFSMIYPKMSKNQKSLQKEKLFSDQQVFGYTKEDLNFSLPNYSTGMEPIGSMGSDTPISVLSDKSKLYTHISNNVLHK